MDRAAFELFRRRALGEAPAGFALARATPTELPRTALPTASEADLWAAHARALARWRAAVAHDGGVAAVADAGHAAGHAAGRADGPAGPPGVGADLLALKVELARRLLAPCRLCWLRCPVDRAAGQTGRCGLGAGLRVYREYVHLGEELELIPTHAVFLAGCNYRCAYCSDWTHVDRPAQHRETPPAALAAAIDARRAEGARSLTFVGGDPDVSLPGILAALAGARASTPVVWNANLSATPEAADLLEGVVDAWVADLKYGSEACARTGSAVAGSLAVVHDNLRRAAREAYLVVRHLVLPGHVECCARPALAWLAAHTPTARVSLLGQYEPVPEVAGGPWDRRPTAGELAAATAHARALGLDLDGPGALPAAAAPAAPAAAPALAPLETTIRVDPGGRVVFEDLPPELAELAAELGLAAGPGPGGDLEARRRAGAPWRPPGAPPPT